MKIGITGLGARCALGENAKTLWDAIEQGHSGQYYVFDFQTIN